MPACRARRKGQWIAWLTKAGYLPLPLSLYLSPCLHPFLSALLNNISISIQLTHIFRYLSLLLFLFWPFFGHILAISGRCSLCDANYEYLRADFDKLLCLLFAQNCCIMWPGSPSLYYFPSSAADLATFSPPAWSVTLLSCRAWKRGASQGGGKSWWQLVQCPNWRRVTHTTSKLQASLLSMVSGLCQHVAHAARCVCAMVAWRRCTIISDRPRLTSFLW